jgi:hypothetical protein
MDCLSSEDLKEEKTYFALTNTLYRILALSSRGMSIAPQFESVRKTASIAM